MEFYRGVVRAYDATNHQASVLLVGSMSRVVLKVPVAHQIGAELMAEGAACGVLFFAEGSSGVVVCTFDGAPDPWVTSALIKDGTVATADIADDAVTAAKVAYTPPTFQYGWATDTTAQTVTNSWAKYQSVEVTVTPTESQYVNVFVHISADIETTAFSAWNICCCRIYRDGVGKGRTFRHRHNVNKERSTINGHYVDRINNERTYQLYVYKAVNRNTIQCNDGAISVLYVADPV